MKHTRTIRVLVMGAVPLLAFGACGDDDGAAANTAGCNAWIAADSTLIGFLFMDQGDADSVNASLDAVIAVAPEELKTTVSELKTEAQPSLIDPETEGSERTNELYRKAITWTGDNCDVETIDVTAKDYKYEGVSASLKAGYHVINFANEGTEAHEMFTFRINDGVTETLEEIFEVPEEEIFTKITPVNAAFALPGAADTSSWNLATPGKYVSVCFIPQGSVGETEGSGAPHFTHGMIHEFTVA